LVGSHACGAVRMYSSLLTGYGRAADKDKLETKESFSKVDAVFNDMRAAGVKPDVAVYNAYIMAACRCEKWLAAVQVRRANERRAFICPARDPLSPSPPSPPLTINGYSESPLEYNAHRPSRTDPI